MKTAMQELRLRLIDRSEQFRRADMLGPFTTLTLVLTEIELELLEKEKEQIIAARNDALKSKYQSVMNDLIAYGQARIEVKTSEQYYNETYKQD